jgi:hypothetical protein
MRWGRLNINLDFLNLNYEFIIFRSESDYSYDNDINKSIEPESESNTTKPKRVSLMTEKQLENCKKSSRAC